MSSKERSLTLPNVRRDVPLAPLTTIGIGGPAKYFVEATTVDELRDAVRWAAKNSVPLLVLSGGSNVLISDDGFDGLVLHVALRGIVVESEDAFATVRVAAGEPWDEFVAMAVRNRWAGIECLSGIPGWTGATPIQNVGAYGQDVSETITHVEVLDRESGRVSTMNASECEFGYRSSVFKGRERDRSIVTAVTFRLKRDGAATIRYPELQQYVDERGIAMNDLAAVRESVIAIRKRKGMVLDPKDPDTRSDGSFFMNPVVSAEEADVFLKKAKAISDRVPAFPNNDGSVKLSAAWLIENSGFHKGFAHGSVGLSSKHTLAIINRGGGTAREVLELVRMIQRAVREKFGVEIHPEPNFIGL
ncbi:MAG: UDP-N-acetylmuramate dehydrogenase [Thermoanaerobaculia bacterium]